MRIAVLSDLHAYDAVDGVAPSHLRISDPVDQPMRHPIEGLKRLIERENITADLLLCPGDLADKANTVALNFVWSELVKLKNLFGASSLIATAGNHDVDSRYKESDFDARGALQALAPHFPGLTEPQCDRYWSRNFVLIEDTLWRILLLNSSAYHGAGKDSTAEAGRGRVSQRTAAAIKMELQRSSLKPINILVCHHHLYRDNTIQEKDYSEMEGGDQLIRILDSGAFGQWIVVHGHKHHPKLQYGQGGSLSPVVFGAGSFSASLYPELAAQARNQFYIVEIDPDQADSLSLDVAGTITAWDWIPNRGFQPAGSESGLPHRSGFGYRITAAGTVARIASLVSAPFIRWPEVLKVIPQLAFVIPSDISTVVTVLARDHGVKAIQDSQGSIIELAK